METILSPRLVARRAGVDEIEGVHVFGLAEQPDGSGWALIFQEIEAGRSLGGQQLHSLSDHLGRTSIGPVKAWLLNGTWLLLTLDAVAEVDLELGKHITIDLEAIPDRAGLIRTELTRIVGLEESRKLRLIVEDVFRIGSLSWPIAVCRYEAGEASVGQEVALLTPDGTREHARIAGIQFHSRPGTTALEIAGDDEGLLAPGVLIVDRQGTTATG